MSGASASHTMEPWAFAAPKWPCQHSYCKSVNLVTHRPYPPDLLPPSPPPKGFCFHSSSSSHRGYNSRALWTLELLQGHYFHRTPVNVGGCHAQVAWENDQDHECWGRIHRENGLVSLPVSLLQKFWLWTYWTPTPPPLVGTNRVNGKQTQREVQRERQTKPKKGGGGAKSKWRTSHTIIHIM